MQETFGRMLKRTRTKHRVSQRQLAAAIGVHHTYISKIESGTERPSPQMLRAIAKALGCDAITLHLAAGYIPDEFRKAIQEHEEFRCLLHLAAQNKLSPSFYRELKRLLRETRISVPVWLE